MGTARKTEGKLEEYSQRQRKRAVHVSKKKPFSPLKNQFKNKLENILWI